MKQKTIFILLFVLLIVIFIAGCVKLSEDKSNTAQNQTTFPCDKEENCCMKNEDCQYIWFTGGCNTPESVSNIMSKCKDRSGPCPSEAPLRENVTCTCENNKCITHN